MKNTNYIRGRKYEYRAIKILEEQNYCCIRSAGSHKTDIIAFLTNQKEEGQPVIRAISVKATKYISKKDKEELENLRLPSFVSCEIWQFLPYKPPKIIEILRPL